MSIKYRIWTHTVWHQKRPLCQLYHKYCPKLNILGESAVKEDLCINVCSDESSSFQSWKMVSLMLRNQKNPTSTSRSSSSFGSIKILFLFLQLTNDERIKNLLRIEFQSCQDKSIGIEKSQHFCLEAVHRYWHRKQTYILESFGE